MQRGGGTVRALARQPRSRRKFQKGLLLRPFTSGETNPAMPYEGSRGSKRSLHRQRTSPKSVVPDR